MFAIVTHIYLYDCITNFFDGDMLTLITYCLLTLESLRSLGYNPKKYYIKRLMEKLILYIRSVIDSVSTWCHYQ